ncbi:hypothetical protein JCM9534A_34480 [Catenuloplanes indicus JCM 9534]
MRPSDRLTGHADVVGWASGGPALAGGFGAVTGADNRACGPAKSSHTRTGTPGACLAALVSASRAMRSSETSALGSSARGVPVIAEVHVAINNKGGLCSNLINCTESVQDMLPKGYTMHVWWGAGEGEHTTLKGRR